MSTIPLRARQDQSVPVLLVVLVFLGIPAVTLWVALMPGGDLGTLLPLAGASCAALVLVVCMCAAAIRAIPAEPLLLVTAEGLVIHDPRILTADWVVPKAVVDRAEVVGHPRGGSRWPRKDECPCSPFDERWTLRIRFTEDVLCPTARTGFFGNWVWKVVFLRSSQPVGGPGRRGYHGLVCGAVNAEQAVRELTEWLSQRTGRSTSGFGEPTP